jgi:chemotaxis protein methyltransferase CheR
METRPAPRLRPHEFEQIRQLAYQTFGLDLKPGKEELVAARLDPLLRAGEFGSFRQYYDYVVSDRSGRALEALVDALATNHTSFLREPEHFDFVRNRILPSLASRCLIDIWCAACATGEEVWTLACLLNDVLPGRMIRIYATDISNKALEFARRAEYPSERCRGIPDAWLSRYFAPAGVGGAAYQVSPKIRSQAQFLRLNLVERFEWQQSFPIVFCRNVMIYFDRATQEKVVARLSACLEPGGYLFTGHAESLAGISHPLEFIRPAIYRKAEKREAP